MPISSSSADSGRFPLEIRQVPGRGRGFFATRDVARGQVVLKAAPLTWSITNGWMKNTCLWCFKHDDRRAHAVRAADVAVAAAASTPKNKGCSQPARFKGVFCSEDCKQRAICAFGGPSGWRCFAALMDGIEGALRAQSSSSRRKTKIKTRLDSKEATQATARAGAQDGGALCLDKLASLLGKPKDGFLNGDTMAAAAIATVDSDAAAAIATADSDADADFDPDDASDDQLASWIDLVWDEIVGGSVFFDAEVEDSHVELGRLVATELCIHDAALALTPEEQAADTDVVAASSHGDRDVAPAEFLAPVKANETDAFRAWLRQDQADAVAEKSSSSASAPATIAPVRVPLTPTAAQIAQSRWGKAFAAAAASYALLAQAWKAAGAHLQADQLPTLSHRRFREVLYREKANSFGIWDPQPPWKPLSADNSGGSNSSLLGAADSLGQQEKECVGFAIYPTAVYFNHSCAPNVAKVRVGRALYFVSSRDVGGGEELLVSYGSVSEPVAERRSRLREHFFFDCTCERCIAEASLSLSLSSSVAAPS
ncbi:hypothetical protein LPJ75_004356 [Coemansia sp. RSA 2598]|nr:hypothetical protein LPJ75_004356 [Coemansia sp. RSA 2598]